MYVLAREVGKALKNDAVVKVNDSRQGAMGRKVLEAHGGMDAARCKKVALLGLTVKPNIDEMRDSRAIAVAPALTDAGVTVAVYVPEGMEQAIPLMPAVEMAESPNEAIGDADAMAIVAEWDEFRALDFARISEFAKAPVLVDLRNIYRAEDVRAAGVTYSSIGRGWRQPLTA